MSLRRPVAAATGVTRGTRGALRLPGWTDIVAGASVALVLVPQSLAYAGVAGLPAERGLLAAVLPPLAGAVFASSRYLQTGPTAITSLLTLGALSAVAAPGSASFVGLAAVLAVMVGAIRVAIGLLRLGSVAYLMSPTVVVGFTSAAALLIVGSQVPSALGVPGAPGNPLLAAVGALARPESWTMPAVAVAVAVLAITLGARRVSPLVPGALVALVGAAAMAAYAGYPGAVVGAMRLELGVQLELTPEVLGGLALPALVIALVGFAEPASIARRYAAADREAWDPDREFIGQGAANLAAGLSGAFPVGGSFSRTALSRMAGARSRWAGVVTGLTVMALLPFVGLLAALPVAALSGVVIAAVVALINPAPILAYRRVSRPQLAIAVATFVATLWFAPHVEYGIVVGIVTAVGVHLWRENKVYATTWVDGAELHLRPHGVLYFVSVPKLEVDAIQQLSRHPDARRLVVHLDGLGRIDASGATAMRQMLLDARDAGLEVEIRDVPPQSVRIVAGVIGDVAPTGGADRPAGASS